MPKVSPEYKEEKRTQLILASEKAFLRLGYSRTTVQDVMDEAGISRGGFYLYFANKADLFESLLERRDNEIINQFKRLKVMGGPIAPVLIELSMQTSPVEEEDRRRIAMIVEYHLEHRDDTQRRPHIMKRINKFIDALCEVIQAGVDRGEFYPRLPISVIAKFLINAQDGWAVQIAVAGSQDAVSADYGQAITFFLRESLGIDRTE